MALFGGDTSLPHDNNNNNNNTKRPHSTLSSSSDDTEQGPTAFGASDKKRAIQGNPRKRNKQRHGMPKRRNSDLFGKFHAGEDSHPPQPDAGAGGSPPCDRDGAAPKYSGRPLWTMKNKSNGLQNSHRPFSSPDKQQKQQNQQQQDSSPRRLEQRRPHQPLLQHRRRRLQPTRSRTTAPDIAHRFNAAAARAPRLCTPSIFMAATGKHRAPQPTPSKPLFSPFPAAAIALPNRAIARLDSVCNCLEAWTRSLSAAHQALVMRHEGLLGMMEERGAQFGVLEGRVDGLVEMVERLKETVGRVEKAVEWWLDEGWQEGGRSGYGVQETV
ncbi:hypothetical protein B0J12DRAFT_736861 [Macrophomina phaseolina]|uniref:Uncharacterized protein n=1 Tax=Macrophomina phaseolina TaxID=35725 RepID=A0ABQ8GLK6_9PEZI|nr:hypothetical protein B0J12DRAFT_736861 [Macrophomina phaseolina]